MRSVAVSLAGSAVLAFIACASGDDLDPVGGGQGGSGVAGGPFDGSAGAGAMGGTGGTSAGGAGGVGGSGGSAGGIPDATTDTAGAGGAAGAVDAGPDVPIDAGNPDACPGQLLSFSGSGPFVANASGGTPPTNSTQGTCGGNTAPDGVYRFTAQADGVATISYSTTAFDGVLYVRTTCGISSNELACEDAVVGQGTETIQFLASQGLDYSIWVDGADSGGGLFSLDVSVAPTEPVDSCPGQPVTLTGSGANDRTAGVSGNTTIRWPDADGTCGATGARDEVWKIDADADGILSVAVTPSAGWDAVAYVREGNCASGAESSCQNAASDGGAEAVELWATSGASYYVFVDGADASSGGTYSMDVRLAPEKPDENCPGQTVTWMGSGSPRTFQVTGDTSDRWPDLGASCGSGSARDAVFELVPPASGTLQLTLAPGGGFNPVMSVRASSCTGADLSCQSSGGAGAPETYSFLVDQGSSYYVIVDGASTSDRGTFTLDGSLVVAAPPERCPGETLAFTGAPLTVTGNLASFLPDYAGTCSGATSLGSDAVYHFVAPSSGQLAITLEPTSSFDPVLYVRQGNCASGTQIACFDNNPAGVGVSRAEFAFPNVIMGSDYYVFVDAASATTGSYSLTIE